MRPGTEKGLKKSGVKKGPLPASLKPINKSCKLYQVVNILGSAGQTQFCCNSSTRPLQQPRKRKLYLQEQAAGLNVLPPAMHWGSGHCELNHPDEKHQPCAAAARHTWSDRGQSTESENPLRSLFPRCIIFSAPTLFWTQQAE